MTAPMADALATRQRTWGEHNDEVRRELRDEVRSPLRSLSRWLSSRGLRYVAGGGYLVTIPPAP